MTKALLLAGFYAWLGFTVGYFYRKWLERSLVPRYLAERAGDAATAPTAIAAPKEPMAEEQIDWLDEDGAVLDTLPRTEIRRRNLLHGVTATLVFHPDGRVFLHQRTHTKDVYPGLYDMCVGGTVSTGESFAENACRELAEELGVQGPPLCELFRHRFADERSNSVIVVFGCVYDGPVTFQPEEVLGGDWATEADVEARIAAGEVCPDSTQGWRMYLTQYGTGLNFATDVAPQLPPIRCG